MIKTILLMLALFASLIVKAEENCKAISTKDQFQGKGTVYTSSSGSYCLTTDLITEKLFDTHAFTFKSAEPLIDSGGDEGVSLNLNNHKLTSTATYAISVDKNSIVKNGIIKDTEIGIRNRGYGSPSIKKRFQITENSYGDTCYIIYENCEDISYLDSENKKQPQYTVTNVVIDHLKIYTKYRGIEFGGGNNIIRNSTIEVDGHTAVFNFGPNPIIENNTIIIHGKGRNNYWGKYGKLELVKGAIKLRDAKDGIIRNNKIIYKGGWFSWGKAPVAINLLDSQDVLIEGNTIEGFEKLVRENGDTSFTENHNTIK